MNEVGTMGEDLPNLGEARINFSPAGPAKTSMTTNPTNSCATIAVTVPKLADLLLHLSLFTNIKSRKVQFARRVQKVYFWSL
jgi:hypothetical protein